MSKIDSYPPFVADLTGLWGEYAGRPVGTATPLLALSGVPLEGAQWMQAMQPPRLDAPDEVDIDSISCLIATLQQTFTALQIDVNVETIENNKKQKKADFDKAQEQQRIADQKAKDAAEAAKKAMVLEWVSAVAAIIGAVLAAVGAAIVTGGLAIGLAVVGVVMAVQTLTNTALKQAQMDGKKITTTDAMGKEHDLSLSWGLAVEMEQAKMVKDGSILRKDDQGRIIDASGKVMTGKEVAAAYLKNPFTRIRSEEELGKERLAMTLVIEIGIAVAMIGCGVRAMVTAGKNTAEAVEKTTKSVRLGIKARQETWERFGRVSEGLSSFTEVVDAGTSVAKGAIDLDIANTQFQGAEAQAENHYYEKKMKVAMEIIRSLNDSIKTLVDFMNRTNKAMNAAIEEYGDLHTSISRKTSQTTS